jgi:glutathione synthase/RimK-type ligase-like ATP-grasp enzyme
MRVAVLRCGKLPSFVTWEIPNVEELFSDDRLVIAAFAEQGVEVESVIWSDPDVDWNRFDLALIRSTWDYIDNRDHFLSVLATIVQSGCRLANPLEVVRWNSDKSYLFDLTEWDVPVVPTWAASGADLATLEKVFAGRSWQRAVLKPRVGAGAASVTLVPVEEVIDTVSRLAEQQPEQQFLVQPLIESVLTEGEWSFIYLDGELSHALLKKPAAGDYRAHGVYGGSVEAAKPRRDDLLQVEEMLGRLPFDPLYARFDLVRYEARLAIMELELIEPILYFNLFPDGANRLARSALSRVRGSD